MATHNDPEITMRRVGQITFHSCFFVKSGSFYNVGCQVINYREFGNFSTRCASGSPGGSLTKIISFCKTRGKMCGIKIFEIKINTCSVMLLLTSS